MFGAFNSKGSAGGSSAEQAAQLEKVKSTVKSQMALENAQELTQVRSPSIAWSVLLVYIN